ncbi:MAG TPA: tRNA (adenosine(37)-N6)-threonylcarbamoyltransferase complex dimerization subunit type 1 TsaB [Gemmatimonadaceae bacterium]
MITLAIDASTYEGSVAVLDGSAVLASATAAMRGRDAERLMPAVESTMRDGGVQLAAVDLIVCGAGPGSFTSLRIAGSLAKGMAMGASKPLYSVSSLSLIVAGNGAKPGRYLALLDAIRGEYFAAVFESDGVTVRADGDVVIVSKDAVPERCRRLRADPAGPEFGDMWVPHARGVALLESELAKGGPVNLAAWEPTYGRLAEAQVKLEATRA